ncbi:piggyBac transposable element-derived protein 4-like [Vespula squamosa]|uniref:PiggyBac transposable element-derived protein 4-like n=1 Tax=Vespula squamosa TaxID=30214 RepID=A0ABD2A185_VESSQ
MYKSKPNKKVFLLSSIHNLIEIEKSDKRIPETISFYNSTKFGIDMMNRMARKYSVKSKSYRWSHQLTIEFGTAYQESRRKRKYIKTINKYNIQIHTYEKLVKDNTVHHPWFYNGLRHQ